MAGARDYFPNSGTGQTSSTYGRVQDSLIVLDEELTIKDSYPIDESAAYTGATTWNAGQWGRWSGTNIVKVSATGQTPEGMFYNDRNSTSDETVGSREVNLITGPSGIRFLTDQLDAADTFAAGDALYVNADGNLTVTDAGDPVVARARGTKSSDGFLRCRFSREEP